MNAPDDLAMLLTSAGAVDVQGGATMAEGRLTSGVKDALTIWCELPGDTALY